MIISILRLIMILFLSFLHDFWVFALRFIIIYGLYIFFHSKSTFVRITPNIFLFNKFEYLINVLNTTIFVEMNCNFLIFFFDINSKILYSLFKIQDVMKVPDRNKKNVLMFKSENIHICEVYLSFGTSRCSSTSSCSHTSQVVFSF